MKNKIVGILVVTLLLSASVLSVAGNINNKNNEYSISKNWVEQVKLIASDGETGDWFGYGLSIDGDYAIAGSVYDDNRIGSAYIFKNTGSGWIYDTKLIASDGDTGDCFGTSVSIDGDNIVIGAYGDNGNTGSAYMFKKTVNGWTEKEKLIALDDKMSQGFGVSAYINGDYVIIGAPDFFRGNANKGGSAYIFKNTDIGWTEEAKLTASDRASEDYFGYDVSIDGDYAIIGAYGDDSNTGAAYIFKNTGAGWIEETKITASDRETGDYFGLDVFINGELVIVGSPNDDDNGANSGAAYIFKNTGSGWVEELKLIASDGETGDWFGRSVSMNENNVFIGASLDDSSGSLYIFKNTEGGWIEEEKLTASDSETEDRFGHTHSLSGDYLIIGSIYDDDETGSAYLFQRFTTDLDCTGTIGWTDVKTGTTITDDFNISNIGDTGTELNWKIESYPDWGIWTFNPSSGVGLKPEDGEVTVDVSVVAPTDKDMEFTGEIKVVNEDDSADYSIIPVSLVTPKYKPIDILLLDFLKNHPHLFTILQRILGLN
jgi:hypothetical protein